MGRTKVIKEAAIKRITDGKIWTGHRHGDCLVKIFIEEEDEEAQPKSLIQGFITDTNEFLDRKEAFKHAVVCGQIEDPKDNKERALLSEDLY